jgi:hypothetical protein
MMSYLTDQSQWERDNSLTRDLQMLQSNLMWLDVGLWSGNKRKMEISESHLLPLVTVSLVSSLQDCFSWSDT